MATRILTTHVGSLPRSAPLLAMLADKEAGRHTDDAQFKEELDRGLRHVIDKQRASRVDIANDGELPRIGFSTYIKDRMAGFGGVAHRGTVTDFARFPDYARLKLGKSTAAVTRSATIYPAPECVGSVLYDSSLAAAREELTSFARALEAANATKAFTSTFITAASPGIISTTLLRNPSNPSYTTDREYLMALAAQLRVEYEFIVSQGHILQLDAPDLALERQIMFVDRPLAEFLQRVQMHVEAINLAVANIPRNRVRLHVCWGNWDGPHIDDVDLEPILPLLYEANVGALSLACALPRHQHEFKLFKKMPPPKHLTLIPGVIDVTTNVLEHPQVVADRLVAIAEALGDASRLIAGTDCGFSTFAGYEMVAEDVVWEKLSILARGAQLASSRLFS